MSEEHVTPESAEDSSPVDSAEDSSVAESAVVRRVALYAALLGLIAFYFPLRMAGAFIAALPTLIVYVLFADQFAEGVRV